MHPDGPAHGGEQRIRAFLGGRRVLIPVLLGMVAAAWLLYRDLRKPRFELATDGQGDHAWIDVNADRMADLGDPAEFKPVPAGTGTHRRVSTGEVLRSVDWGWHTAFFLVLAVIFSALRDLGYIFRIRTLSDKHLSWSSSFNVIMLWEFASAMTPSVVGGSWIAMFILRREGIPLGRSTAVVLVTALLDELFYVFAVVMVFLAAGFHDLFPRELDNAFWGLSVVAIFVIGYAMILAMVAAVFYAVFFHPRAIKYILLQVFRLRILRRWRPNMIKVGDDLVVTSEELKGKPLRFWAKTFVTTCLSWVSRFLVINCLAAAFFSVSDHLLLFARQLVMWVILLISPTPGASGVAEVAFSGFFRDLLPAAGFVAAVAIIWRLLTYYLYLFVGVITLPRWLRRTALRSD